MCLIVFWWYEEMHSVYCPAYTRYCHKYGNDISGREYCANCEAELPPHETLVVRSRFYNWGRHIEVCVRRRCYKQQQQQNVSIRKDILKSNREFHIVYTIHKLQIMYILKSKTCCIPTIRTRICLSFLVQLRYSQLLCPHNTVELWL
jgi:hypothetical protein